MKYNKEARTFEVIATCAFKKGQEVTCWYSNECDDIMFGVYGFSHPLIPQCKSSEEWRHRSDTLEEQLKDAYADLKMLEDELEYVEAILGECDCCDEEGKDGHKSRLRHEDSTTRGSARSSGRSGASRRSRERNESQRVRRIWSRKTEF